MGFDVPVLEGYYGGSGGQSRIGCLLFDAEIVRGDFEKAVEGHWAYICASWECALSSHRSTQSYF